MSIKKYKIGKYLRNILLKQPSTLALSETCAKLFDEYYVYPKITKKDILESIEEIRKIIND